MDIHELRIELERLEIRTAIEILEDIIVRWNAMDASATKGRGNRPICLMLYEDGSGKIGVGYIDPVLTPPDEGSDFTVLTLRAERAFRNHDELIDYLIKGK